jgi:hypothetical protein
MISIIQQDIIKHIKFIEFMGRENGKLFFFFQLFTNFMTFFREKVTEKCFHATSMSLSDFSFYNAILLEKTFVREMINSFFFSGKS